MPIDNVDALASLATLRFDKLIIDYLATEAEFFAHKKMIDSEIKVFNSMIHKVKGANNDVSGLIATHQRTLDQAESKAAEKQQKEEQKTLDQDKRKADAAAKSAAKKHARTNAKGAAVAVAKPVPGHESAIPPLPDCMKAVVPEVKRFPTVGDIKEVGAEAYTVEKFEPLEKLLDESSVKASVGIYKIQFHSFPSVPQTGRHQHPLQTDRKARFVELFSQLVPGEASLPKDAPIYHYHLGLFSPNGLPRN